MMCAGGFILEYNVSVCVWQADLSDNVKMRCGGSLLLYSIPMNKLMTILPLLRITFHVVNKFGFNKLLNPNDATHPSLGTIAATNIRGWRSIREGGRGLKDKANHDAI